MKNKVTHFVVDYGIFICEACAIQHQAAFPFGKHHIKEIFAEHYDPHQLKILAVSSNKVWHDLTKEYLIHKDPVYKKYTVNIAKWHRKTLRGKAYNRNFFAAAKPVNFNRSTNDAGDALDKGVEKFGNFIGSIFN